MLPVVVVVELVPIRLANSAKLDYEGGTTDPKGAVAEGVRL
jgi:hypothetical protein